MTGIEEAHRRFYDAELPERAGRPLGEEREGAVRRFVARCVAERRTHVLEVGCGAGRDGRHVVDAGLRWTGVDLSPVGAAVCRDRGLSALAASALALPFQDGTFDAVWTMSTLMHLPGDGLERALREVRRVLRPGGVLELGVWGADEAGERVDPDGRYFRHRTDGGLRRLLGTVGEVEDLARWEQPDDGGAHYQWARVRVGATS